MGKLVCFLIAAYNEEKYIFDCINSCLMQSYENIQVCIVDDGSTDNTWNIISKFANDPRVRSERFLVNKGKVPAFNAAFALSDSDYFCLMGADDTAPPDRVDLSLNALHNNNANLVYGDYVVCDSRMQVISRKNAKLSVSMDSIIFNNVIPGGTVLFDKSVAAAAFPIPGNLRFEDWWIAFVAVHRFAVVPVGAVLLNYRMHDSNDSISNSSESLKLKDYRRHSAYYDQFLAYFEKVTPTKEIDTFKKIVADSKLFKDLYITKNLLSRLNKSREYISISGLPKTKQGWFAIMFIAPFGYRVFDFVYKVIQRIRASNL